ncbi:hypothetical protein ABIA39_000164 [Nocardia sp. GAS34]
MLPDMASTWSALGKQLGSLARVQGTGLAGRMQRSTIWDRALGRRRAPGITVRPAASVPVPTQQRARQVLYCPHLDGRADPGEIVWTWVPFEEDPSQGKDRPVLVVGREGSTLLGLMLSSNPDHTHAPHWVEIGSGPWDYEGRPSWVRLDRVLDVPEEGIRREGAVLPRKSFDVVAHRLCREYHWQ